jgi:hypothetical protein
MNNLLEVYLKVSSIIANLVAICALWFIAVWAKDQYENTRKPKFFVLIIIIVLIFIGNFIYHIHGGK